MKPKASTGTRLSFSGSTIVAAFLLACSALTVASTDLSGPAQLAGMTAMDDSAMSEVTGQALFVADKIGPESLLGALGAGSSTDFTFYRIGLDVELALNMNISKLQLGCGGVNDGIDNTVCDIDFDYVRFMGRSGSAAGAVGSNFILRRPYIEFAVKNDGSATGREIAGIKIGAQAADGYVGVGRRYSSATANLEQSSGGTLNCNPASGNGNGVAGCNAGVNSLSGFLGAELSAQFPAELTVWPLVFNSNLCAGAFAQAECGAGNALFTDLAGTRIKRLDVKGLQLYGSGIVSIIDPAYAWLTSDLSLLHGFSLENTQDFFLSFQRESISYPRYSKTAPPTTGVQACNPTYAPPAIPGRCGSAYAVPTHTGWWLNVPEAKLLGIRGDPVSISGLPAVFAALGYPGFRLTNAELNIPIAVNCYGQRAFC